MAGEEQPARAGTAVKSPIPAKVLAVVVPVIVAGSATFAYALYRLRRVVAFGARSGAAARPLREHGRRGALPGSPGGSQRRRHDARVRLLRLGDHPARLARGRDHRRRGADAHASGPAPSAAARRLQRLDVRPLGARGRARGRARPERHGPATRRAGRALRRRLLLGRQPRADQRGPRGRAPAAPSSRSRGRTSRRRRRRSRSWSRRRSRSSFSGSASPCCRSRSSARCWRSPSTSARRSRRCRRCASP